MLIKFIFSSSREKKKKKKRQLFHTADSRKDLTCLEILLISVACMQNWDQAGILVQAIRTQT